jgi:uncharacterized protein YlxW (UPF0749 family)
MFSTLQYDKTQFFFISIKIIIILYGTIKGMPEQQKVDETVESTPLRDNKKSIKAVEQSSTALEEEVNNATETDNDDEQDDVAETDNDDLKG